MKIELEKFETSKTATYATFGNLSAKTRYFWFALHGSKMLCDQVIYKFTDFNPEEHFVVAPEALNRFYLKGFGGDVVASWMTSRERLNEISDISTYLSRLYRLYTDRLAADCTRIVFGFSQGGTMSYRWLHAIDEKVNHLISYSCWIPEDINLKESKTNFDSIDKLYTYGEQDQYLTSDNISKLYDVIARNEMNLEIESYPGDHRIDREQLQKIFEERIKK